MNININTLIIVIIVAVIIVVGTIGAIASSKMVNAVKYSNLIEIESDEWNDK